MASGTASVGPVRPPTRWVSVRRRTGARHDERFVRQRLRGGPRIGGTTAFLQLGAAVSQQLRIGGAVHVWWRSGQPDFTSSAVATERLSTLGAVIDCYPAPTSGFFLGCGVGVSNYHSKSGDAAADASGWGFTVG